MDPCHPVHILVAGIISPLADGRFWVGACLFWQHLDLRATELSSSRTPGWHRHKGMQNAGLSEQNKNANPTLTRGRHHSRLLITSKSPTPPPNHSHPRTHTPLPTALGLYSGPCHLSASWLLISALLAHLTKTMIGRVDSHSLYSQLNEWLYLPCVCRWRGRSDDFQMNVEPTETHVKSVLSKNNRLTEC